MRSPTAILALLLLAVSTPAAHAHADLAKSSPAAGATVRAAPAEVVLTFSERVEAVFSKVTVTDANGAAVDQGKPQVAGNTMRVGLKPLNGGTYKVNWRAVSPDTHRVEGSFTFRIDPSKSN